jgi:hypothetical protein
MADYDNGYPLEVDIGEMDHIEGFPLCAGMCIYHVDEPLTQIPMLFPTENSIGCDTPVDGGIVFYYPTKDSATDSVCLPSQSLPLRAPVKIPQNIHQLGSGKLSIYGRGLKNRSIELNIEQISTTKRMRLYKFLVNICDGAVKTFDYEDEAGNVYRVRWIDAADKGFGFDMFSWLMHSDTVLLYVEEVVAIA